MNRGRLAAGILAIAAAASIVYLAWPRGPRGDTLLRTVKSAEAKAADFYVALRVEGVLEAARSAPIVNRASETQIISALPDGTWVEEGDVVIELNSAELQKEVDDLKPQVVEAEEKVRSVQADAEKRVQNARSGLTKAQEAQQLARNQNQAAIEKAQAEEAFLEKELSVAQGQRDKRTRLLEERLIPVTDLESAEDEVRAKQFALEAAHRALGRARSEADVVTRLRELDLENAKIELDQAQSSLTQSVAGAKRDLASKQRKLEEAQEQFESTILEAPVAGMLLLEQTWDETMSSLRVGDRVREGQRVANVIDPSEMSARCDVSEADIALVKAGQLARIHLPAIGSDVLVGEVTAIDNVARQRLIWEGGVPGKKIFGVLITVKSEDPRLRPGMGAAVEIVLDRVNEGIAVPLEAVMPTDDGYVVYRHREGGYQEVPVTLGKRSDRLVAVQGELQAGDIVACERPAGALVRPAQREKSK